MSTTRLEAFSDGVFAIAITLLVIEIHAPDDTDHLGRALLDLWPSYLAFAISFLLIGLVWANHHAMFVHVRATDRALLFLNTLLLMDVVFLPFVASVLAGAFRNGSGERTAVGLYGLTLVVGGVFFNAVWGWVRRRPTLLEPDLGPDRAHAMGRRFLLGPALYAVGTVLGVLVPVLGVVVFAGLILFYWLPASRQEQSS